LSSQWLGSGWVDWGSHPSQGYLQRLRAICDKHGILLIFDEVITGFGRLGAPFGADYFDVKPDFHHNR
jgi:adenosylmethionine-8-amino-7-oxononanoate aminotransferase